MNLETYFRSYDIRGRAGQDGLNHEFAYKLAMAIAQHLESHNLEKHIVLAHDIRLSSPELFIAMQLGFEAAGVDCLALGLLSTPLAYFSLEALQQKNLVMITGSHNPKEQNGFKFVFDKKSALPSDIEAIKNAFFSAGNASIPQVETISPRKLSLNRSQELLRQIVLEQYQSQIFANIRLSKNWKLVVDSGNGCGGIANPEIFRKFGLEVIELFSKPDGNFPNHHPDPARRDNMQHLIDAVEREQADFGFGFDGDADRLGVIDAGLSIIPNDLILAILSEGVLAERPDSPIIFDVKCSHLLSQRIEENGGTPVMWKTGHGHIKEQMRKLNSPFAGELSGHIFFADRWFGFDDALYSALRLLETMEKLYAGKNTIMDLFPKTYSSEEINLGVSDNRKFQIMQEILEMPQWQGAIKTITLDGMRAEFPEGWVLIRPSNTSAILVLRIVAHNQAAFAEYKNFLIEVLEQLEEKLELTPLVEARPIL